MQVLLADDHRLFQDAVVAYLGRVLPEIDVLCVENIRAVEDALSQQVPDLLLLDWKMPGMLGFETLRSLIKHYPQMRMAVLSGTLDMDMAERIRAEGVMFMPKTMEGKRLVSQISGCLGLQELPRPNVDAVLTRREKDVLSHLRYGVSNKEIASRLGIQVITVKLHVRNLCRKLGLKNRTQLALYANQSIGDKAHAVS